MKRIIICADGTWNEPSENEKSGPTNVLKVARAIAPLADDGIHQVVFYDWGLGSDNKPIAGGAFGKGINKNIMDNYRFIVQNYHPGDELYFFGFSRGAYTVRSLAGFINNCSILKRENAAKIEEAFEIYKDPKIHPADNTSKKFRDDNSVNDSSGIKFIGVWDTVGALGIPIGFLGFLNRKHQFHDNKIGPNIDIARHAISIDEKRNDFEPTIWKRRKGIDLKQVWFAGVHADVGGSYLPDSQGRLLSDIPLLWMVKQAESTTGLRFEPHLTNDLKGDPLAGQNEEFQGFYKVLGKKVRQILKTNFIHRSVKERYEDIHLNYRPDPLVKYLQKNGWNNLTD